MTDTKQLDGKVALVTGGSSGIGFEIARRFALEGAKVVLVGTSMEKAKNAEEQIRAIGGSVLALAGDVSYFNDCADLVSLAKSKYGPIDILVNSAGVWHPTLTGNLVETEVDRMIGVNLKGPLGMINAVTPLMKERRSGCIINLASIAGIVGSPTYSVYSATKSAVIALTKVLALELAQFDIRVNAIAPGNTETPMNLHIRQSPEFEQRRAYIGKTTPSNRSFTPPNEIAEAALFLANGRVLAMHGATMVLDEGRTAGLPAK